MSQQSINLGTADSGNGDPLRVAFAKVNNNFAELYNGVIATGVVSTSASPPVSPGEGDLWWDTNDGNLYVYYLGVWASANAGLQGPQGDIGLQGVEGPAGIRGLKGNTGDIGPRGFTGETGAQGEVGPRGLKGDQGDAGANGTQGIQGIQGIQGEQGPRGLKGDQGDPGTNGTNGTNGETGPQGEQGPTGSAGTNGTNGEQGPQGDPGSQVQFSLTAPNPLTEGNVWWNMNDGNLYVYYNSQWVSAVSIAGLNSTNELVNGAYTTSLGANGVLTFPNGVLKIAGNTISNYVAGDDGGSGSQLEVSQSKTVITNGVTNSLGGGPSLTGQSLFEVSTNGILSSFQVINTLGEGESTLTGEYLTELDNNSFKIGQRITNDLGDGSEPLVTFNGWTFGIEEDNITLAITFPDATTTTGKGITIPVDDSLTVNLSASGPGPEGQNNTFKINPESIKLPTGNGTIFSGTETAANEWNLDSGNNVLRFPDAGDAVYPQILYSIAENGPGMELLTYAKSIRITAASNKSWTFDNGGKLTLPADSSILTNETALKIATHSTATYTFDQAYWEALNGDVTRMYTFTGNAQYFSCTVTANQDGTYTVANTTGNSFDLLAGSWFKIPGDELGGATPANDIQITVATVDGGGAILTTTITGAAVSKQWQFGTDGRTTFPNGTVPEHSYGAAGDKEGMLAFDATYIYYCTTDNISPVAHVSESTADGSGPTNFTKSGIFTPIVNMNISVNNTAPGSAITSVTDNGTYWSIETTPAFPVLTGTSYYIGWENIWKRTAHGAGTW